MTTNDSDNTNTSTRTPFPKLPWPEIERQIAMHMHDLRNKLAQHDISQMRCEISASGSTHGDLNIKYSLGEYSAHVHGTRLQTAVDEFLRREYWEKYNKPLQISYVETPEDVERNIDGVSIEEVFGERLKAPKAPTSEPVTMAPDDPLALPYYISGDPQPYCPACHQQDELVPVNADSIDIGVGEQQVGPHVCENCGWVELTPEELEVPHPDSDPDSDSDLPL